MMRSRWLLIALVACGKSDAPPKRNESAAPSTARHVPVDERKIDKLEMTAPTGWTSSYDGDVDTMRFAATTADGRTAHARVERAPATWVASPDAYVAQRKRFDLPPNTKIDIEKREGVKDGFALTVLVTTPKDPEHPTRESYVVRQLGSAWYQCVSDSVPDDAFRDQLVALCKSLKL
jgi:hypothetical protein